MAWESHPNLTWEVDFLQYGETDMDTAITALTDEHQQNSLLSFKTTTLAIAFALDCLVQYEENHDGGLFHSPEEGHNRHSDSYFDV